jgi:hypothetical protein
MKYILIKLSSPGWEKEFKSEIEARQELYSHICITCCMGGYEDFKHNPITINTSIDEMLGTPCGCEFAFQEIE